MTYTLPLLISELERDEGRRRKIYQDTADPPRNSIGIGRNLDDVGLSDDEIDLMLSNDIKRAETTLTAVLPTWRDLTDARQRALLNMAFNLGQGRLAGFRAMLAAIQSGDYAEAADEALSSRWASQVGSRAHRLAELMRHG